jgi:hypothetical protein
LSNLPASSSSSNDFEIGSNHADEERRIRSHILKPTLIGSAA